MNAQIIEDYVSFETAKLLKEKGFLQPNITQYYVDIDGDELHHGIVSYGAGKRHISSAPTLEMAMKWLRETHNIFIQVDYIWSPKELYTYTFDIYNMKSARSIFSTPYGESFDSYEEACEAAIKYCLTNLI